MQKALLAENANKTFNFGDFISLDDIIKRLKVDVIIEPGTPIRSVDEYYEKATKYWRNVYERLYKKIQEDDTLRAECQNIEVKLWKLKVEREAHSSMRLLGLYDSQKNAIKLFPEAMAKADASKMDEYLVSTFAHEVMHAYFNRPGHDKYPYAMFVEEPLAEFGMLLYLHEINSPYYGWTCNIVSNKKCCYGYGADIMAQYLGGDQSFRKYIEEYKIFIGEYEMLDELNGNVSLPVAGSVVNVGAQPISANWTPVHSIPPTYFWDEANKTLGLDGDWGADTFDTLNHQYNFHIHIDIHFHNDDIQHLYLGKDFVKGPHNYHFETLFSSVPVTVSSQHNELTSINGIPVLINDNTPVIESCGRGYYILKRNGKYSIIDAQLNPITPFNYEFIWSFDDNGLCMVRNRDQNGNFVYGLVNQQGVEQVPVEYEDIDKKGRRYEVKQNGEVFIIDEFGNRQPESNE
jgi:hypothetical protein